jgi:hypothetical protein
MLAGGRDRPGGAVKMAEALDAPTGRCLAGLYATPPSVNPPQSHSE